MDEVVIILTDYILDNAPINKAFSPTGFVHSAPQKLHEKYYSQTALYAEICAISVNRSTVVQDFMLQEKYLDRDIHTSYLFILSAKGEIARREKGHQNYLIWKEADDKRRKKEENHLTWPQKNWVIIGIATFLLGIIGTLVAEWCKRKIWPDTSQTKQTIQAVKDTSAAATFKPHK